MEPEHERPLEQTAETTHLPPEVWDVLQLELSHMPERAIIDFLIQYFVENVSWYVD